ncbi:MAG TPA: recombinase family protein [Patescibacteria group bacterium]|nr:recombinase family protein [Patescibacteria group bacterium]
MTSAIGMRRVVWYARVSSDDQRDRATIQTQIGELERAVARTPEVAVVERYVDDGVSGMIPIAGRPAGGRLVQDRLAGRFSELWVYDVDRLGRDAPDIMRARRDLAALGISIFTPAGEVAPLLFDLQAVIGDYARVQFLQRSADGMARAAREGRYTGGIVPLGYRVQGSREQARLEPDPSPLWADQSAADVVRWIYERLGLDRWSCRRIADELNARGVPTHYARDGRGVRGRRTQGVWRSGRIRNLVVNPVYRGELRYGRRTTKQSSGREVIAAPVEPLVSPALWHAAQETLAANRTIARNTRRRYLLRGVIRCGIDGLSYCGTQGRGHVGWYRCTGQLLERGPLLGRCWGQSIRTDAIEPVVWADIERWLRDPGDILGELDGRGERDSQGAVAVAESITLTRALGALEDQRRQALALNIRGRLTDAELDGELDRIAGEGSELERRVAALEHTGAPALPEAAVDLLGELRSRLDAGLTEEQRQEIVRLLVRVVVHTETPSTGRRKTARATVEYRFPAVVETSTGRGSSRPRAGSGRERPRRDRPAPRRRVPPRAAAAAPRATTGRTPGARRGKASHDAPVSPPRETCAARRPRERRTRRCDGAPGTGGGERGRALGRHPPRRR